MDIMKLLFKSTEKLVNKYHFCPVEINRKGHKENVCLGVFVSYERWCVDSLSSADCAICILHDFVSLTSVLSLFLFSFLSISDGKELLSFEFLYTICSPLTPCLSKTGVTWVLETAMF